jgi:hypothetical protein
MVIASTRTSGVMKRYKTATEAAYGATDIVLRDIVQFSMVDAANPAVSDTTFRTNLLGYLNKLNTPDVSSCLRTKLANYNSNWTAANAACASIDRSLNANRSYDIKFNLNSASGSPYVVYSKIVDTQKYIQWNYSSNKYEPVAGNSAPSSADLKTGNKEDYIPHLPYRYRIEVQAERTQNAVEKAKLTVQYVN